MLINLLFNLNNNNLNYFIKMENELFADYDIEYRSLLE